MRRCKFEYMLDESVTGLRRGNGMVPQPGASHEARERMDSCRRAVGMVFEAVVAEALRVGGISIALAQNMAVQALRSGWSHDEIAHALVAACCRVAEEGRPLRVRRLSASPRKGAGPALRWNGCAFNQRYLLIGGGDFRLCQARQRYEVALLIADMGLVCLERLAAGGKAGTVPENGRSRAARARQRRLDLPGSIGSARGRRERGTLPPG